MADLQPSKPSLPQPKSGMGGLFSGATYPLRALRTLRQHPHLRRYVIVPIGVNVLVGSTLYLALLLAGFRGIDSLIARLPTWLMFLDWLLSGLLTIALFLLTGLLLLQFGVLLGSPWYGKLSEELEKLRLGTLPSPEPFSPFAIARDLSRAILFEVKKLLLVLGGGIALLLLNLWPGVGTAIASVGGITLATTIVCLDFFDAPLERRRLRFRQKLGLIYRCLPASASFGLVSLVLVGIPFLNLLAIPLCVTAGTLLVCDRMLRD